MRLTVYATLITAAFIHAGCRSMVEITKDDLVEGKDAKVLRVTTNEGQSYRLVDCSIEDSVLIGSTSPIGSGRRAATEIVAIPLSEILKVESLEYDGTKTALGVIGGTVLLGEIVVLIIQQIATKGIF